MAVETGASRRNPRLIENGCKLTGICNISVVRQGIHMNDVFTGRPNFDCARRTVQFDVRDGFAGRKPTRTKSQQTATEARDRAGFSGLLDNQHLQTVPSGFAGSHAAPRARTDNGQIVFH
jgi:hypothetical protein